MTESRPWGLADVTALLLIAALAGVLRFWYVAHISLEGSQALPFAVQGPAWSPASAGDAFSRDGGTSEPKQITDLAELVHNLEEKGSFSSHAPLADKEERTAHGSPMYPWLVSFVARWDVSVPAVMRWTQAALGTLAVICYFLFARRAFQSLLVGFLTGLLAAIHPFWIFNVAEVADGALATFLLAVSLMLGTRAGHSGGPFVSLLYGLALAALALTRAALLPFAVIALLWFLLQCRHVRAGCFCGLLAFLGFGNGLAPWLVRNFREFDEPVPIVDSAMLHLWMGNNPLATGGTLDEERLRRSLPAQRVEALLAQSNQAKRYSSLGWDVVREVSDDPGNAVGRRLSAGLVFLCGENWFKNNGLSEADPPDDANSFPGWLRDYGEGALRGSLLALLILAPLGWRFTFGWRKQARLATLAALWVPLPYLLTHAEFLSGPRLPLDGVWICFAAFALACCLPGVRRVPDERFI